MLSEPLIELEVSQHVGAERYEHNPTRTAQRNGYRERQWDTRMGSIACTCRGCATVATIPASWSRACQPSGR